MSGNTGRITIIFAAVREENRLAANLLNYFTVTGFIKWSFITTIAGYNGLISPTKIMYDFNYLY